MATFDGRYDAITSSPASDCNQRGSSGDNDAAAAAVAYTAGYNSGVEQRDHDTYYRYHSGRYDRGYQQQVSYSDLDGARASSADSTLGDRGFRNVDGFKQGQTAYTIWYNRNSGQCLQMTVGDGRVVDISDIGNHPACR